MKAVRISGTENYAEEAPELLKRYESISFADYHRLVMHLIPTVPGRVLDIGAGTGREAAGFVGLGTLGRCRRTDRRISPRCDAPASVSND